MGSGNKHVFLRLYPPITRQRKKGEFLGFFPKECMGIIRYISTVSDRFMKVTFFKLISNVWLYTNIYEPLLLCTQTIFCAEFCPRHLPV